MQALISVYACPTYVSGHCNTAMTEVVHQIIVECSLHVTGLTLFGHLQYLKDIARKPYNIVLK